MTGFFIRKWRLKNKERKHRGKKPTERGKNYQPRNTKDAGTTRRQEEERKGSPLEPSEGAQPC